MASQMCSSVKIFVLRAYYVTVLWTNPYFIAVTQKSGVSDITFYTFTSVFNATLFTINYYMFWPYLAILSQLFAFLYRHTALGRYSKYFNAIAFPSFTLKYIWEHNSLSFLCYFPLIASAFFCVSFSPLNIGVVLSLFLCAPLVCTFPLVDCMSLSDLRTSVV
jgi:hypothetical protein